MDNLVMVFAFLIVSVAACAYMTWLNRSSLVASWRWVVSVISRRQPPLKLYGRYHDAVMIMMTKRAQLKKLRGQYRSAVSSNQGGLEKLEAELRVLEREYPEVRAAAAEFLAGLKAEELHIIAEIDSLRLFHGLIPAGDIAVFLKNERGLVETYPRLMEDHITRKVVAFGQRYQRALAAKGGSGDNAAKG